jgi:hypothetical protein
MKKMCLLCASLFALAFCCGGAAAQTNRASELSADERALEILFKVVEKNVVGAAEAMPADKYQFAPTEGEFKGVRTFGQQVKHAAATNYILAAAALGEKPPPDAGDETGPESVRTKAEIIEYLKGSFEYLHRAAVTIDEKGIAVGSSPISPLHAGTATRMGLTVEALIHAYDHYGQMVEYLRMNGIVPPASR